MLELAFMTGARNKKLPDFVELLWDHPGGLKVSEIAERLGIARTSVYRLRDQATELKLSVEDNRTNPEVPLGIMRLSESARRLAGAPSPDGVELAALLGAIERAGPLRESARAALIKIQGREPAALPIYSPLVDDYDPELVERLVHAIRERRVIQLSYKNAQGTIQSYPFWGYALIARDPHLYLAGRLPDGNQVLELRVDQIQECKLLPEYFKKPDFDVAAYCRSKFRVFGGEGETCLVRIRFSAAKAGFARRTRRHASQSVEELADGSLIYRLQVPISEDLVHWIVGWGPHAEVLEPLDLRRRVWQWAQGCADANREAVCD